MYNEKAALYGGVIALVLLGILMAIACILCKVFLMSKRAQRWSGLDRLLANGVHSKKTNGSTMHNETIIRDESQFILKVQQGDYVGYDAMEKHISITKLPLSVSKEGLCYTQPSSTPQSTSDQDDSSQIDSEDDVIDMEKLKSSPPSNTRYKMSAKPRGSRYNGHSFHNNYTIYEETSDLSGSEAGAKTLQERSSTLTSDDDDEQSSGSSNDGSVTHSDSCSSFGSCLDLLDNHLDDRGLGQVEYSLQYHRDNSQLVLHIIQAKDLELPCDANGDLPDVFIKTFATGCHNDNSDPKKQTKICKNTANPIFEENFLFRVASGDLPVASITLQVFSRDHYARQKLLGEICFSLSSLTCTGSYRTWSNILDYDHQPLGSCAEVKVTLSYDSVIEELRVALTELRSLKLESSPLYKSKELFMATTLLANQNLPKTRKRTACQSVATTSHSSHLNSDIFIFNQVHHSTMHDSKLVIELCQEYPDRSHDTLGYTILGAGASDTEYGHWLLIDSKHVQEPVTMWHNIHLRPTQPNHKPHFHLR